MVLGAAYHLWLKRCSNHSERCRQASLWVALVGNDSALREPRSPTGCSETIKVKTCILEVCCARGKGPTRHGRRARGGLEIVDGGGVVSSVCWQFAQDYRL